MNERKNETDLSSGLGGIP